MKKLFFLTLVLLFAPPAWATVVQDGTDDAMNCGTSDTWFKENTAMTFYIRANFSSIPNMRLYDRGGFFNYIASDGTVAFFVNGSTGLAHEANTGSLTTGEHVIILTWDGSTTAANSHIYIDGTETGYKTTTNGVTLTDTAADNTVLLNSVVNGNRSVAATVREIGYWSSVITATDIATLSGTTRKNVVKELSASPIRYYKLDDGTSGSANGLTATDNMGNVNCTYDDGANNTGDTFGVDNVMSYQRIVQ